MSIFTLAFQTFYQKLQCNQLEMESADFYNINEIIFLIKDQFQNPNNEMRTQS